MQGVAQRADMEEIVMEKRRIAAALPLGEELFAHFSWLPLVSEILVLPPFLYWFYKRSDE